ncbi:hypothetical protein WJX82_011056 [Trebouxia sp. C0006]
MTSVLAPSFLLELGAYAIAAAGIRLFRNRSSQARQQEAQEHPQTVYQHTSPRVIGLSQASPLLSTCRSSSRSPQPCPDDEVQSPQAAGTSCKDEAKGQGAVAQAADVVMPEADAVLLSPQPITPATGIAATPSDVPSRIIAPADTAFGHVTALSLTPLKGSRGNRFDNMGSDSISSHSHNSSLVHGNASRDFDVTVDTSDDCTSAENNTGVPSSNAACHNRAASKAPEAAAEGEQQQLQGSISKDEQQDMSSGPDRADAILPENVKLAHRDVDASSAGDCERTSGPSSHPMSEDDPDVDIMTREESPACDHMAVDDPSDGGNDVISDSETSKQEEEEVASGMEWAWGADTLDDDQCDNVDQDRSLLLSAIQKHKRSAEPDPENSEMQLFVSSKRPCGPLIDGVEEDEVKGSAQPATGIPEGVKAGAAKAAQPNDLLQEIASVTLRLLAGALRHSPASEAAQPSPSPLSQAPVAQQEQSPDSDFINPAPSQDGETLAESEAKEHSQVADATHQGAASSIVPMTTEDETDLKGRQTRDEDEGCGQHVWKLPEATSSRDWVQRWVHRCHCEEYEQAELKESDELCQADNAPVEHSAQRAEETEESGDEAHANKGDKYQPGERRYIHYLSSGLGNVAQPTLDLPRLLRYAGSCFSNPDVHEAQHGELAQASPAVSDEYESRAYCAHHPAAHAQTDWGRELPIVDSAPPIASSSPPGSPTTSSAWGSPDEPAVNSPSGSLAHSYSPEWGSARGAVSNRPRWPGSPDYVPPFWNLPEFASASAATAADDRSDYWQSLKEAEDRLSEPAMSPDYLPSGGGVDEEDQQMYAEPDHEEEDNGMAEIQQGQIEEEDHPDASKYEGAYASVCKATRDYVRDAWDLSDSSEEDAEDNVPARADLEHEAEDDGFQVKRSKYPDSGEEDEGMHGTRAAAGSSPGQALTPGPNRMLSQDEEEDCMLEEDDCKEKYLAASRESEGMLNEEGTNVEDDDVQFMGETGPDPSKSAFQLARKRLASIRASQRCGEEEDDVELYPGVQDLISGTLQSGRSTAHQVGDFAAELSKGSTILRHFKRLRKLPSASRTSELERSAFWSRHSSGGDLQPRAEATAVAGSNLDSTLRESLSGGLPDSKEDEADRFTGQD